MFLKPRSHRLLRGRSRVRGLRRLGTRGGNGKDKLEPRLENMLLRFRCALFVEKGLYAIFFLLIVGRSIVRFQNYYYYF